MFGTHICFDARTDTNGRCTAFTFSWAAGVPSAACKNGSGQASNGCGPSRTSVAASVYPARISTTIRNLSGSARVVIAGGRAQGRWGPGTGARSAVSCRRLRRKRLDGSAATNRPGLSRYSFLDFSPSSALVPHGRGYLSVLTCFGTHEPPGELGNWLN